MSIKIENTLNEVAYAGGINTAKPIDASGASSVALPMATTMGGVKAGVGSKSVTTSTAANAVPTSAQLLGGIYEHKTTGAGGTFTLPLGVTLSAAISSVATGQSFDVWYANTGTAGTGTITGATGTTVVGTATVPTGKNAVLRFYNSGTGTWNIYTAVSN